MLPNVANYHQNSAMNGEQVFYTYNTAPVQVQVKVSKYKYDHHDETEAWLDLYAGTIA